jgi:ribonuclease P protein component
MVKKTFHKSERISSKTIVTNLFTKGSSSFNSYPIRFVWIDNDYAFTHYTPVQVLVSVPKKNYPSAVDRNVLKRRIKEAWRLHKQVFYNFIKEFHPEKQIAICLLYNGKEIFDYNLIEKAITKGIEKFKIELTSNL